MLDLLRRLADSGLSRLMFTGRTLHAIRHLPLGPAVLAELDLLIAGPFVQTARSPLPLLGSENQQIHFLTPRHDPDGIMHIPRVEVVIHKDGTRTVTGFRPATT